MVIVLKVTDQQISTTKAVQMLLSLIDEEENDYQNKIILVFNSLIEQLPNDTFEARELELTTRLIHPLLQPLFEDRSEGRYFRWTDAQTEEYKKNASNCSSKRPDGCITLRAHEDLNVGFIEVKDKKHRNNKAKLNRDLWKLGMFSRDANKQNNLLGALSILIVGKLKNRQKIGINY